MGRKSSTIRPKAEPIVKRNDRDGPQRIPQLPRAVEDLRERRPLRRGGGQLLKAREVKPKQPEVYAALSAFYNRQGEFEKTVDALNTAADLQPENPQGYQLVAVFYWEKAFKDKRLTAAQQKEYIAKGIEATDRALKLNPDYIDALTYKNILLRMQANLEPDVKKRQPHRRGRQAPEQGAGAEQEEGEQLAVGPG